ncbi:hypothetical protein [Lyngbya aestuarii]|uniref:hypothetical protein n=1 Tax=Lyngbya aestuarii TaxID=118322 RepID=UPI00403D87FD
MKIKLFPLLAGVAAIAISAAPMIANAQGGPGKFSNLNLTSEQQTQLDQIRENADSQIETILSPEQAQQFQNIREQRQQGRRAMKALNLTEEQRNQMREVHQSARKQMEEVLTEEQLQQLRQQREAHRGEHRQEQGN